MFFGSGFFFSGFSSGRPILISTSFSITSSFLLMRMSWLQSFLEPVDPTCSVDRPLFADPAIPPKKRRPAERPKTKGRFRSLSIVPGQHFQQFDLEDQVGVGLDMGAELCFAVAEVGRDEEFAFAADFHTHQALIPAFDHASGADHALEGFAAIVGGVELGTVFEKTVVLGGDQCTLDHCLALAHPNIFDL